MHRRKRSTLAGPLAGPFEALTDTNASRHRRRRPLEHTFLTVGGADLFSNPPSTSTSPPNRERASPPLNKVARRRPGGPMIADLDFDADTVCYPTNLPKGSRTS